MFIARVMSNHQFLSLLLIVLTSSPGLSVIQAKMDSQLKLDSISTDLGIMIKDVWCNGQNYTELCGGWRDLIECYGFVMQGELWSIKNNTDLYNYSPESIGNMLAEVECEQSENMDASQADETEKVLYYWLGAFCSFLLVVAVLAIITVCARSYIKCGSFNIGNTNVTPNPSDTLINKTCDEV